MPKEIVKGCKPIIGTEDNVEVEGLVQVGWHSEMGYMQIATLSRDANTLDTVEKGMYVDLDRRGINSLIRNLRRARDQAFGRDE